MHPLNWGWHLHSVSIRQYVSIFLARSRAIRSSPCEVVNRLPSRRRKHFTHTAASQNSAGAHLFVGINNRNERWSHGTQYYQPIRQWVMSTVTALIYALLLRLVSAVQLQGFYFHHEEGGMERAREGEKKITEAKRGFSTSSDQIPPFQEINLGMR